MLKPKIWQQIQGAIQKPPYGAAKYVEKADFDKETGEILKASSLLEINEEKIKEEEALDGYNVLITSEMDEPDDKIIEIYKGL